jgi:lysophospholipase L1-like esterase
VSTRWRRGLGRAGLALGATLIALGAAEGIHRARLAADDAPGSDDDWYVRYRRMNETLYRPSPDPELVYEPVPGASIEMEYGRAAFNSAGMRDDREPSRDPGDRVRVAVLGDSLVWSEFLPLESSLPVRTEHALGERFEVLGFGVTGYDTMQEAAWYERAVRPYRPRIVVVVWCMNDLMIMSGPFERFARGEDRVRKDAQDAHFERVAPLRRETLDAVLAEREARSSVRLLARALAAWERRRFEAEYVDEYLIAFEDPARRARATAALTRLGAAIRADGATPILVVSPILERWDRYRWPAIHAFVRGEAERAGFVVHDPLETWRGEHDPELLRIGGDHLHYGERGTAIFGETIARAIREAAQ